MISTEQAIARLYGTYGKYGVKEDTLRRLFEDEEKKQGFSTLEVYNLLRMTMGQEYGEREYFALQEVATMLNVTPEEVIHQIGSQNAGAKESIMQGFKMYIPNGL